MNRPMPYRVTVLFLIGLTFSVSSVRAQQLYGENLKAPVPVGFKIGAQHSGGRTLQLEYVADTETVQDWNVMITTLIVKGTIPVTPDQFSEGIAQSFQGACSQGGGKKISEGLISGYAYVEWQLTCDLNPMTNKPEFAIMRSIQANDAFFNVQYAFRKVPSDDLIRQATDYLDTLSICDTRVPDKPCDLP